MLSFSQGLTFGLMTVLLLPHVCLAQDISIWSPTEGTVIYPGQELKIVYHTESTTSSYQQLSCSVGFNAEPKIDPTSLGRPYVGSYAPGAKELGSEDFNDTIKIRVPKAADFLDGFSSEYNLKVSTYYVLGATYTPKISMASVRVTIVNSTSPPC